MATTIEPFDFVRHAGCFSNLGIGVVLGVEREDSIKVVFEKSFSDDNPFGQSCHTSWLQSLVKVNQYGEDIS